MSAVQTTPRYIVLDRGYGIMRGFKVYDLKGRSLDGAMLFVDSFNTRSAANHAAHLLNHGEAYVRPHDVVGCRVMPV